MSPPRRTLTSTLTFLRLRAKSLLKSLTMDSQYYWDPILDAELPPMEPFRFLDLPAEVRLNIYKIRLLVPNTIDLDPNNRRDVAPLLKLLQVNRQVNDEAHHVFYSMNTFRIFCTNGKYFGSKYHVLTQMRPRTRAAITQLELRLGHGFTKPPKTWTPVNVRLGLKDCKNLRFLKVFVELDPMSHEIFKAWRMADDGFSIFAKTLLAKLLERITTIENVQFDGYPSVRKDGHLMKALLYEVEAAGKPITWGPKRGWTDEDEEEEVDSVAGPRSAWFPRGGYNDSSGFGAVSLPLAGVTA